MNRSQYVHSLIIRFALVACIVLVLIFLSGCAYNPCNQPHIMNAPGCETDREPYVNLQKHWKKYGRPKI